jgi:hypothetical protein
MKLDEFKKLVRPMIKEMVKEVMLEEGVLSNIVSEVASGLNRSGMIMTEARTKPTPQVDPDLEQYKQDLKKQAMMEQVRSTQPVVFENTTPAPGEPRPGVALSGTDPNDPGVDISSILRTSSGNWGKLL